MKTDAEFLIVGQGIAGILVAVELLQRGKTFLLMDDDAADSASQSAGALLNPVNLNRAHTFSHQTEEWREAREVYRELETLLGIQILYDLALYFIPGTGTQGEFEKIPFVKRPGAGDIFKISSAVNDAEKMLMIANVHRINFSALKTVWKNYFLERGIYHSSSFSYHDCIFEQHLIRYHDLSVQKIIFAEGARGVANPIFKNLPFIKNEGNFLHLKIRGLPANIGFHFDKEKLIPMGDDHFWFGSNYVWNTNSTEPDHSWREKSVQILKTRLKVPFEVISHRVALRPTTEGQQPIMIRSQDHPQLFMFNGLGTRGFSTGPALAKRFCDRLL